MKSRLEFRIINKSGVRQKKGRLSDRKGGGLYS